MKRRTFSSRFSLVFLLFMQIVPPSSARTPGQSAVHYEGGEPDSAKQIWLNRLSEEGKSPEILFNLGKVEQSGERSRDYFEEVIEDYPRWRNSDEAGLFICQYEFSRGRYSTVVDLAKRFRQSFPQSKARPELLWLCGCSYLALDQPDSALLLFDEIATSFPSSEWVSWAQAGKGDCFFTRGDYDRAIVEYNKIIDKHANSESFFLALSGLMRCFIQLGEPDRALLYYNLLQEEYPESPVLIGNPLERVHNKKREATTAEDLSGGKYAIQLGVFGDKGNALKLRSRMKQLGYSVAVKRKIIQGKGYYVVRMGSFDSYEEALKLKRKLELQTSERYLIVSE